MAKDVSDPRKKAVERSESFTTVSGVPVERLYTPEHIRDLNYAEDLADPGKPPYTRGIYPEMYLIRLWTMCQFIGFGTPAGTIARLHYLLNHGQTVLSVAFYLPTLMGDASDHT